MTKFEHEQYCEDYDPPFDCGEDEGPEPFLLDKVTYVGLRGLIYSMLYEMNLGIRPTGLHEYLKLVDRLEADASDMVTDYIAGDVSLEGLFDDQTGAARYIWDLAGELLHDVLQKTADEMFGMPIEGGNLEDEIDDLELEPAESESIR